ncbi:MAG: pirin family protein [Candidatus Nitrosothermus koennekii]|nr:MAG: pirin family protein [Candidatus Nitrosothermus koennekii]
MDRKVKKILSSKPTLEGAGVLVNRAFGGYATASMFDPFLLLDDFGSKNPHEYIMGFPWHPHRGIETITYLLKGEVHHEDSTGNKGVISSRDAQFMTAGSGIFHAEMPKPMKINDKIEPEVRGVQLWYNLSSKDKMSKPKYSNLSKEDIPEVRLDNGINVRVLSGSIQAPYFGTIKNLSSDMLYLDIDMNNEEFVYDIRSGYTVLAYVLEGKGFFNDTIANARDIVLYSREGERIRIKSHEHMHLLLISAKPLNEPIAWYGPIVMNTQEEIVKALQDLKNNEFVKDEPSFDDLRY